jgi:DNA-binding beta-propeller fold protein YncE
LGVAVDSVDNIYVADTDNNRIVKIDSQVYCRLILDSADSMQFDGPDGVTVDSFGNIYVADNSNDRIIKFDSKGEFIWCQNTANGPLDNPIDIAVDFSQNVYVADSNNNRIVKLDSNGGFIWNQNTGNVPFDWPCGIAVDSAAGTVYVSDYGNSAIHKFSVDGAYLDSWDNSNTHTVDVAVDSLGYVYSCDRSYNKVRKFDSLGTLLISFELYGAFEIAIDGAGNMYLADAYSNQIVKLDSNGEFLDSWSSFMFPVINQNTGEGYPNIQSAITAANPGDTIFVYSKTFYENVIIDKPIVLLGEDRDTTIIDGMGYDEVIKITTDHVTVSGFTLQGANSVGMFLLDASYNTLSDISFRNNVVAGLYLRRYSHHNEIYDNHFELNDIGLWIDSFQGESNNNIIYSNNFERDDWWCALDECSNTWYDDTLNKGNYWNDHPGGTYTGFIWDTPYDVPGSGLNQDMYPLVAPWPPLCGDANTDGIIDVGDVVYSVTYLYRGGPAPEPVCIGDANNDGIINVGDVVYLVSYLYRGGPAPDSNCCG